MVLLEIEAICSTISGLLKSETRDIQYASDVAALHTTPSPESSVPAFAAAKENNLNQSALEATALLFYEDSTERANATDPHVGGVSGLHEHPSKKFCQPSSAAA